MALNRKDGQKDKYAIGFVTHTVCKVSVMGKPTYEAWRLPAERLGGGYKSAEEAQGVCERDYRSRRPTLPAMSTADQHAKTHADTAEQGEIACS